VSRYAELTAKVDAFFTRVEQRHGADMQCATGCADCCHARLTVTPVEATAIVDEIATWARDRKIALHALAVRDQTARCAALGDDDRCRIYAARPLVCRSHGAPVRMRDARSLPVVQVCARNFVAGPERADADCIIDQTTLSALLLAVNRAEGADAEAREDLAALLVRVTE